MYTALALASLIMLADEQQTAVIRQSVRAPGFRQVTVQRGIGANVHNVGFNRVNFNINRGIFNNRVFVNRAFDFRFNNIQHNVFAQRQFFGGYGFSRSFAYPAAAFYYAPPAQIIYQVPQATYAYPAPVQETYAPPQAQAYYAPAPVQYEVQQAIQYLAAPTYYAPFYAPYYVPRHYGHGGYGRSFQFGFGRHH